MSIPMTETRRHSSPSRPDRHEDALAGRRPPPRPQPSTANSSSPSARPASIAGRAARRGRPSARTSRSLRPPRRRSGRAIRACKRCRPDKLGAPDPQVEAVKRACELIAAAEEAPKLADLAASAGMSPFHFHRVFKKVDRRDAEGLCRADAGAPRGRRLRTAETVTEAIYDAGFNSSSRFYETAAARLGMTPSAVRRGGAGRGRSASRSARPRSARCWSPRPTRAFAPSCSATIPTRWCASLQDRFPRAELEGGDAEFERMVAAGRRPRRGAGSAPGPAARHPRHRVPAAGLAGAPRHPAGQDGDLRGDRARGRPAEGRARGRSGLRRQSARGRDPLPSRGAGGRRPFRLSLGRRAQAQAASTARRRDERRPSPQAPRSPPSAWESGAIAEAAIDALDWPAIEAELDAYGCAVAPKLISPRDVPRACGALCGRRPLPLAHRDGEPRLWPGRVQIFRRSAAGADRRASPRPLSAARADRRPLERRDGRPRPLPRRARGVPRALPRGGSDAADAAPAALWPRRLQLPAPGRLRRASLSAPGRDPALRARTRLRRRRVRADRAAAAHAVARRGREPHPGRRRDLRRARAAGAGRARTLSRQSAPWGQPDREAASASRSASSSTTRPDGFFDCESNDREDDCSRRQT